MEPFWNHLGSIRMALDGVLRRLGGFRRAAGESVFLFGVFIDFHSPGGCSAGLMKLSKRSWRAFESSWRALESRWRAVEGIREALGVFLEASSGIAISGPRFDG